MNTFPELNRTLRGHAFYEGLSDAPEPYSTEQIDASEKMVVAHFFNSSSDWFVVEVNQESMEAFGYAVVSGQSDFGEWGYVDLIALESLDVPGLLVERDIDWSPCTFPEAMRKRGWA